MAEVPIHNYNKSPPPPNRRGWRNAWWLKLGLWLTFPSESPPQSKVLTTCVRKSFARRQSLSRPSARSSATTWRSSAQQLLLLGARQDALQLSEYLLLQRVDLTSLREGQVERLLDE